MTPDDYRALGYVPFPCRGKRPRGKTWPGNEPFRHGDNIGLVVPEGVVVIDLDRHGDADGIGELVRLAPDGWQHTGPRAITGSGGLHLWFRSPPLVQIGNSRGSLPTGIDVRGGGRGYVIVAPSVHPGSGRRYEWHTPLCPIPDLPVLPGWLCELILRPKALPPKTPQRAARTPVDRDLSQYLEAALVAEMEAVRNAPDGEGNETINRAGYKLGGYAHAGLSYDVALSSLEVAIAEWSWRNPRDRRAALRTFSSGWRAGEQRPRAITESPRPARPPSRDPSPPAGVPSAAEAIPEPPPDHPACAAPPPSDSDRNGSLIVISHAEMAVNDAAIAALARRKYRDVYQRDMQLMRVLRSGDSPEPAAVDVDPDTPIIRPMALATVRERLADCATWVRRTPDGDTVPAHPPDWSVRAVHARGVYPGIRPLRGVASYPVLRTDGTIATEDGYDSRTCYYLAGVPAGIQLPHSPTQKDAQSAARALLDAVCDFPFCDDVDRAAWLTYLLTPLARVATAGPTPLFLIEANVRGTGKTLLADVAGHILMGGTLPSQTYPYQEEELEKILVSVARYALPVICLDNVTVTIGGAVLDKWLTTTSPQGRTLGQSEVRQYDWQTVVVATGNNAAVRGDTDRRTIYVRLETELERPELRTGYRIADLPSHLHAHRAELLSHCYTILLAHARAGRPAQGGLVKGTYESWCSVVRDAVMYAGLPDAERPPDDEARAADESASELGAMLHALEGVYRAAWFTTSEIMTDAYREATSDSETRALRAAIDDITPRGARRISSRQLGRWLGRHRHRWLSGLSLTSAKNTTTNARHWRIRTRSEQ